MADDTRKVLSMPFVHPGGDVEVDVAAAPLRELQLSDPDPRLQHLEAQLRRLVKEVEGRCPEARAIVRPGRDGPAPIGRAAES